MSKRDKTHHFLSVMPTVMWLALMQSSWPWSTTLVESSGRRARQQCVMVTIKLLTCLRPNHFDFMTLQVIARKAYGGGGRAPHQAEQRDQHQGTDSHKGRITYKVKHPYIDSCPCCQGAEHSLGTDLASSCINSRNYKHTHIHLNKHKHKPVMVSLF